MNILGIGVSHKINTYDRRGFFHFFYSRSEMSVTRMFLSLFGVHIHSCAWRISFGHDEFVYVWIISPKMLILLLEDEEK